MKLAVVIPFYNGDDYIEACLASVASARHPVDAIYIVNNSDKPSALERLTLGYRQVEIIQTAPAIGFARACNRGVYQAVDDGAEVAIILNQDAVMTPDTIERLLAPLRADEAIFAVVPLSLNYALDAIEPKTFDKYVAPLRDYLRDLVVGAPRLYYPLKPLQTNGACVALRASMIGEIGLFDPLFYHYGEDIDLFARAIGRHGRVVALAPAARIGHLHTNFNARGEAALRTEALTRHALQMYFIKNPAVSLAAGVSRALTYTVHSLALALARGQWRKAAVFLSKDLQLLGKWRPLLRGRYPAEVRRRIEHYLKLDGLPRPAISASASEQAFHRQA
jgi:GT2 family glycosyltransferase